uniref:EF-hand domain-containing protein n=1 Tax=Steinernema glaseri TaxID=37863 RepID=A0A1I7ZS08_9BILA
MDGSARSSSSYNNTYNSTHGFDHVLNWEKNRSLTSSLLGGNNDTFGQSRPLSFTRLFRKASCDVDYSTAMRHPLQRANPDSLHSIFDRYASIEAEGKKYMNPDDFIRKYLGLYTDENYNKETVELLASAADTTKDGLISFEEFCAFEAILCSPDALYLTAFEIFDKNASDSITCDEFEKIIRHTQPLIDMDFDFNSDFIKKYFGVAKKRQIGYFAFCQLLHDFYEEQGIQAFKRFDKNNDGSISAVDFMTIMTTVKGHLLTDFVRNNLIAVSGGGASGHKLEFNHETRLFSAVF